MTATTIIKNIIKQGAEKFIADRTKNNTFYMDSKDTSLKLENGKDDVEFELSTLVNYVRYTLYGYITKYGNVKVYSIHYKVCDKDGSNERTKLVYGEDLQGFRF